MTANSSMTRSISHPVASGRHGRSASHRDRRRTRPRRVGLGLTHARRRRPPALGRAAPVRIRLAERSVRRRHACHPTVTRRARLALTSRCPAGSYFVGRVEPEEPCFAGNPWSSLEWFVQFDLEPALPEARHHKLPGDVEARRDHIVIGRHVNAVVGDVGPDGQVAPAGVGSLGDEAVVEVVDPDDTGAAGSAGTPCTMRKESSLAASSIRRSTSEIRRVTRSTCSCTARSCRRYSRPTSPGKFRSCSTFPSAVKSRTVKVFGRCLHTCPSMGL